MTKYVETKICEIEDPDFKTLIAELCECVNWGKDEFENKSLANLLTAIVTQEKKLNINGVMIDSIFAKKVKDLTSDSVVYSVCCELASRNSKAMDNMLGKSVFVLIKQCYRAVCPRLPRTKTPTRLQKKHQITTTVINRRRSNGSFF